MGAITENRTDNVVRVFWHEETRYSVMVQKPESAEIKTISFPRACWGRSKDNETRMIGNILILADVPDRSPMWVFSKIRDANFDGCIELLEIHIHSVKDVEGASWNHGKFGSGSTTVIQ